MMEPLTPFDIPLIVDLISRHLARKDYANCTLVNKACYLQFRRLLWRKLTKEPRGSNRESSIRFDDDNQLSFQVNASSVRYLKLRETGNAELLRFFSYQSSSCYNLYEFDYTLNEYHRSPAIFSLVMDVMERSIALRKCSLRRCNGNNIDDYCGRFFQVLSKHPSLTTLKLLDPPEAIPTVYRSLLYNLPPNIENLVLYWSVKSSKGRSAFQEKELRQTYPHLRTLSLSLEVNDQERSTIVPFLMRCPNLEALEFCHEREFNLRKLMSVVCNDGVFPKLKSFSLASAHDIPREYLTPFATTMQGRIKTFTSYSISSSSINVLISSGWADTLEVIRLQHLPSKDISRILGTCSNLRTFSVSRNGLTTLYSGEQDDREAEWVCLDLENFEMTYLDGRPSTKRGDNGSDITATTVSDRSLKEERTVECIKRVYRQLGRLKRLQHLRIGWRTSADFEQCANLDLSFKSGLRHLKTLKELRVLDVGCIQQLNIGFEEVEWIAESWPELQLIKGYYAKETTDRVRVDGFEIIDEDIVDAKWNGMKDPVHIDWLRSLRPDILIT